ncbi:MAG: hypothetical protein JWP65_3476 [Ramlibacter sp.]|jgi:hypothetical protein|uniref:hypothetical protein n=1 Tax=Ramlibacter sp. TaxID=1917967 RepID=UPI00261B8045|nr:hypothetical protein [Ramlibacter sp.]MDB5753055.1 hypothetical protein [Ramlibacter sp.]
MPDTDRQEASREPSEFFSALRWGLLLGAAMLVLVMPQVRQAQVPSQPQPPAVAQAPAVPAIPAPQAKPAPPSVQARAATAEPTPRSIPGRGLRMADFSGEDPSPEVRHIANWAVYSHDHKKHAFVVVDKKDARVYVFGPEGKLKESAPALLGSARGDHTVPGVGDKPLSQVKPDEKTTPAGRFVAEPGKNTKGEDIVWVDYDAAVSMHRIRPLVAADRRLERLATLTVDDNRISFGCINLPVTFYEEILSPTVRKYGAIVYVLPETRTPQQLFGSYDVQPAGKRTRKA